MRKTKLAGALVLVIGLILAGCAVEDDLPETEPDDAIEPDDDVAEPDPEPDAEPDPDVELVTLDRIGHPDAPNSFTLDITQGHSHDSAVSQEWANAFEGLYREWAEANPDWQIEVNVIPGGEVTQHMAVLLEQARVGRAPDCAEVDSFVISQFINADVLQPLNEHFSDDEIDDLFPFIREVVAPDGNIYAFWWNTDLRVLYYRTDLIPEAPQTWDELIDASLAAQEADPNVEGFLFNGGRWEGTTFDNLAHFWAQGGDLVDEAGQPIFGEGDNREYMINTMAFLRELVESGASPERVSAIDDYADFNTSAQAGTVAAFVGGHWQRGQIQEVLSEDEFALLDFDRIPGPTADQRSTGTGGWTLAAFTDDADKVAACMDFVRTVYRGPANDATGQPPTSNELFDTLPTFQEEHWQRFGEFLEDGRSRPGVPVYPSISEELQVAIGDVLTGQLTPEEAVDQAFQASLQAYEALDE